ncbi:MAG: UvrB/UvrC motif-containing protein [bacterium]|nr:UvrB/UvrC motif-containing protein [bacterium]
MILCDICKKAQATFHRTNIVNNQITEIHLCQSCAEKEGMEIAGLVKLNIEDALASLLNYIAAEDKNGGQIGKEKNLVCPRCQLSFTKFSELGRLGCPECYTTFAAELEPLLRRLHGSCDHQGKMPPHANRLVELNKELHELRRQLQLALKEEDFERAAQLRDAIKKAEMI